MPVLKFTAVIKMRGVNPYVDVSQSQAAQLRADWRKPLPVLVRVNGRPEEPWRINMMPAGNGDYYLYLHGMVRQASETKVGDTARLEVAFDEAYRNGPQHPLPELFSIGLAQNAAAQTSWEKLPPSRQKEVLRYIASLKSSEAVERNVVRALEVLGGKPARFMGRAWRDGS